MFRGRHFHSASSSFYNGEYMNSVSKIVIILLIFLSIQFAWSISLRKERTVIIQDASAIFFSAGTKTAKALAGTIVDNKIVLRQKKGNLAIYNMKGKFDTYVDGDYGAVLL